jgi:hypothetical protein
MFRCPKCVSMGLVCCCLWQGIKAPPAAAVSLMTSPAGPVAVTASTTSNVAYAHPITVNAVFGKIYDVSPARKALYGEDDDRQMAQALTITLT